MNAIVTTDRLWAIGRNGGQLFTLAKDFEHFSRLTQGGTVILSRQFLKSFPDGQPLPQRRNIVITWDKDRTADGCETAPDPEAALALAGGPEADDLWIIGSGNVYAALLARCRRAYVTRVDDRVEEADTFFPNLDKLPGWEVESTSEPMEEDGTTYRFIDYINTKL